jgi:NDP-sugar pyrophosphorylase family protein
MNLQVRDTDAVILCGGLGTRLRGVVADRPKPMADVGGKPFLQLLVDHVSAFGFRRFVLCSGHMADSIESRFGAKDGEPAPSSGLDIVMSRESQPLGTGGAVWNAGALIHSGSFIVLNGDSFCAVDYGGLLAAHGRCQASVTVVVTSIADASQYGTVEMDRSGRIAGFREKTGVRARGLVNAGVYVFRRSVLDEIRITPPFSLERDIFPRLAADSGLHGWVTPGPLLDIGTPERYREAELRLIGLMEKGIRDLKRRPRAEAVASRGGQRIS